MTVYLRTHTTGLKYFGYTNAKQPRYYKTDNNPWGQHLTEHGNTYSTRTLLETNDQLAASLFCIHYSLKHNIWNNPEYANQIMENGLPGNKGVKKNCFSKEYLKKMSDVKIGRPVSKETRLKISKATQGELNPFYGKHHTPESKTKMRQPRPQIEGELNPFYGKHHTEEFKLQSSIRQGIPVTINNVTYHSRNQAARELNILKATLSYRLKSPNFPEYQINEPQAKGVSRGKRNTST